MAEPTKDLHVHIDVHIDDEKTWEHDHHTPVPPDYPDDGQHYEAFAAHEIETAIIDHQRQHFGFARHDLAIKQYEARLRIIENLIRHAPRTLSQKGLGARIVEVIHMETEALYDQYGEPFGLEH